jgi:DNA polymerase-3 subunit alpha
MVKSMNFVNLYIETEYTMLTSPIRLQELVRLAKEYQYEALAITDLNNMHGVLKFYELCLVTGIKPIIGLAITMDSADNFYNSLLLYAKGDEGYRNLLKISSIAKLNDKVKMQDLRGSSSDLIAVLPSDESEIVKLVQEDNPNEALKLLFEYRALFNDLYLGLDLQTETNRQNLEKLLGFGKKAGLKTVALHKTLYLHKEDLDAYQVLRCLDQGTNQYLPNEKELNAGFISKEEGSKLFQDYPELLSTTVEISNKCQLELKFDRYKFPVFPDALGKSFIFLSDLCKLGLNKRLKGRKVNIDKYKERLLYELEVINQMGFCDYFLIVYDFIKYAKKNGILVGPGRGSGPGSLVSYVLGITDIDPLEHNLLFERFLNPERTSMPDIDTDFPDNRRDEVIAYVANKYGKARVAHISAFGTFGVRLALRDVARVLKVTDVVLNEVLKFVPEFGGTLTGIINQSEMFRELIQENEVVQELVRIARKLEGLPRHITTHAAGIIIADQELVNYTPIQKGINNLYQTQFEAVDLERIGLVKMDFLGIRNLTIISEVVKLIKEKNPEFNLNEIPLDDKTTYRMIAEGDTDGIFQLESSGMRNVLRGLKTSEFNDIVNANALYRPGPREMIPSFIKRKFKQEPIEYLHPDLKEILEPTYGIIVFQEQIMLIAQKFAGYTLGMADILRRAISKKVEAVLIAERERFVKGAVRNGYDQDTSNKIYDYIVKFASYGFNKSHSVAYSFIAYQMAYLKSRYYIYFMSVLMTNSIGSIGLIRNYIADCRKKNIKVYLPSINQSEDRFVVKDGGIYYSLLGIQNLGAVTVKAFLEERKKSGPYKTYDEFIARTKDVFNRRLIENLIWAGALDEFKLPRKQMVVEYENSLNLANFATLLGDNLLERNFSAEEYSFEELSGYERESLGFNFKYSLLSRYQDYAKKIGAVELRKLKIGRNVRVIFTLRKIKRITTKTNQEMAFLSLTDDTEEIDAVLFPNVYSQYKYHLETNGIYLGEGNVEERNGKLQFIVRKLKSMK